MIRTRDPRSSTAAVQQAILDVQVKPEITPVEFKRGRLGKFDESVVWRVEELSKLGLTQEQMAMAIGVTQHTFEIWLQKYPAMRESMEKGRWIHDTAVQQSLLRKALGYTVPEVKHVNGIDVNGRAYSYTTTTKKHIPPSDTAIIFWLKNRDKENWRDVHGRGENTINVDMRKTLNLTTLSKDEIEVLESVAMKQIEDMNGTGG